MFCVLTVNLIDCVIRDNAAIMRDNNKKGTFMTISFNRQLLQRFAFALGLGVMLILGVGLYGHAPHAYAQIMDCSDNSVMHCGFSSPSNFISTVKSGDSNGHTDLAAIYAQFGLPASEYSRFISEAQPAVFYKDGRVVVSGQVVATQAISFGRWQSYHTGPTMITKTIGGTTIYGNYTTRVMTGGGTSLTGYVLFDASGTPQFMVMDGCGNVVIATVVKSSIACNLLNTQPVAGKLNTYDFTASASATGFAGLAKYVYDFGDGNSVTKANGSDVVEHTYSKIGSFNAKVTVYATTPWGVQITSSSDACAKPMTSVQPYYLCTQLGGAILDQNSYSYRFTASMSYGNGATFISGDFDFGDGQTATAVKSADGKTVSVDHTYAKAGDYSASASLRFSVNGTTVTASTCKAYVTPTAPPTPECKPGIPVGDIRCTPCQYDASLPANDVRCVAPVTTLPNTGAGNVIAVGSAALVAGFLWYRHLLFQRHKRAYLAADMGISPLPLGEPLDPDTPLAGTPLQARPNRKYSLRRPRQF